MVHRELPPEFDLTGRTALVTGAGSQEGIGFACARLLGSLGAAVLVTSTSDRIHARADELRAAGVDATSAVADLTVPGAAAGVVARAGERWGAVHVLVNNAGMVSVTQPDFEAGSVAELSTETLRASFARNVETA